MLICSSATVCSGALVGLPDRQHGPSRAQHATAGFQHEAQRLLLLCGKLSQLRQIGRVGMLGRDIAFLPGPLQRCDIREPGVGAVCHLGRQPCREALTNVMQIALPRWMLVLERQHQLAKILFAAELQQHREFQRHHVVEIRAQIVAVDLQSIAGADGVAAHARGAARFGRVKQREYFALQRS
jgi:hypothetical protein